MRTLKGSEDSRDACNPPDHRKKTFEEEYVELLRLSGVEFDEKFLW